MGKYSRLGKNTALVFVGRLSSKLISLLMLPFYTRWLSVEGYGTTDILYVYMGFLVSIVSCCIAESLFIFPKGQPDNVKKEYLTSGGCFIALSSIVFLCCLYAVDIIAQRWGIKNSFTDNVWLIGGMVIATMLQEVAQQFTRGIDKMVVYSATGIVMTCATAIYAFLLIPGYGVEGFVWATILANLTAACYSFVASSGYKYLLLSAAKTGRAKELLKYSIPLIPNAIMWWLVSALNRPVMESSLGVHAIGLFAVANKFPGILSMVFTVFATSWQISVMEEYNKQGFHSFYNTTLRTVVLLLFMSFACLTLFNDLFIHLLTTPDYYEAAIYIPMLTLATLFSCISSISGSVFSAVKQSKYFFYSSVWGAVTAVIFNFILIPRMGIWGAVIAIDLSFIAMAISRIAYSMKYVKIDHIGVYAMLSALSVVVGLSVFVDNIMLRIAVTVIAVMTGFVLNYDILKDVHLFVKQKLKK